MFRNTMALTLFTVLLAYGSTANAASNTLQQTIYYGGDIITMEGDKPSYVEAVIERDGKIIYAGEKAGAVNNFAGKTIEVDLKGQTMMPGFIEPHAHPVSIGSFMAPAEPLLLAWVAANRIVASGKVMNPEQKISVYDAMKGVTITAARTFEMEDTIGSIKVGKEATFTLLEQNPFKIAPEKLKDIPVVGVVYKGNMKLNKGKLVGEDRDAHGCIGSAGFSWCSKTDQCERPWELAKKHGFENNKEAFNTFCGN